MKTTNTLRLAAGLLCAAASLPAAAHSGAAAHAPIGVMADHRHAAGEWMLSYRFMHMQMQGSRDGQDTLSPAQVSSYPNPNAPPPGLRVVPLDMQMQMHMLGVMWAPNDHVTAMLMGSHQTREMDHLTYGMATGTNELGRFTTESEGWGDTRLSALIGQPGAPWHVELGLSLPTGSTTESHAVLTPMNTRPTLRMPYAMQIGSGTVDVIAGVTGRHTQGRWQLGGQFRTLQRQGRNDEGYRLGDHYQLNGWSAISSMR